MHSIPSDDVPSAELGEAPREVELYLDRLTAPMRREDAEAARQWREEARGHLASLAAAYLELGSPPQEAWRLACRRFGAPERLGHRYLQAARGGLLSPNLLRSLAGLSLNVAVVVMVMHHVAENLPAPAPVWAPLLPLLSHFAVGLWLGREEGRRRPGWCVSAPLAGMVGVVQWLDGNASLLEVVGLVAALVALSEGVGALGAILGRRLQGRAWIPRLIWEPVETKERG